jgi:hypothetical protein
MPRCCIVCTAEASPDLQLQYCAVCQSALYCSKACQRKDWRERHKRICKLLNVGHGDMQVWSAMHTQRSISLKEQSERIERSLAKDMKRFFKLFEKSTFEGSQAAARKMRKIAERQIKPNQKVLLFYSFCFLVWSDSEMLSWPNSPLLVFLQIFDPNVLSEGDGAPRITPLHTLAQLADLSDYSTHENQLILAKQLIEHGAKVNAVSSPQDETPLHFACYGYVVTNLDFVELLLEEGADPNMQNHLGKTALMCTTPDAPGAAKFLLKWPTTDVHITTRSGVSFLNRVRLAITYFANNVALLDNPDQVQHQFLLRQWREIEEMLVKRGAHDTGITTPSI